MTAIIQPVLHFGDLDTGVRFLTEAFGFTVQAEHRSPEGDLAYVEVVLDGCSLGVGATSPEPTPFDLGPSAVYVAIDDPDAMHERAVDAGAEIVMELVDQPYGSREFAARDPDGNVWCFGTYRAGMAST